MLPPLDDPDDTEEQGTDKHMELPAVLFSAQYIIVTPTISRNAKQTSFSHSLVLISAESSPILLCFNLPGTVGRTAAPGNVSSPQLVSLGWDNSSSLLCLCPGSCSPGSQTLAATEKLCCKASHTPAAPQVPSCHSLWFLVYWWPVYTYFFSSRAPHHLGINSLHSCGPRESNCVSAQPRCQSFLWLTSSCSPLTVSRAAPEWEVQLLN